MFENLMEIAIDEVAKTICDAYWEGEFDEKRDGDNISGAIRYLENAEKCFNSEFKSTLATTLGRYKTEADELSSRLLSGGQHDIRKAEAKEAMSKKLRYSLFLILVSGFGILLASFFVIKISELLKTASNDWLALLIVGPLSLVLMLASFLCAVIAIKDVRHFKENVQKMTAEMIGQDLKHKEELYLLCNAILKYLARSMATKEPEDLFADDFFNIDGPDGQYDEKYIYKEKT